MDKKNTGRNMTIKNATSMMLRRIYANRIVKGKVTDKMLAAELGISPAAYSRIATEVNYPSIHTWAKICKMHTKEYGTQATNMILNNID